MAGAGLVLLPVILFFAYGTGNSGALPRTQSTYVEAMVGAPHFVNPLLASSDTDTDLAHLVYSGLTRMGGGGNVMPDLADRWDTRPDARVFTFTLKPDLRWHDGEPLTSDDVLFTLDLLRAPDFPGDPALAAPWRDVQVGAPNPHTVVFTLPAPNASFVQFTTLGLLPRHAWGNIKAADLPTAGLNQTPIGSGPWRYKRSPVSSASLSGANDAGEATPVPAAGGEGVLLEPNPYLPYPGLSLSQLWFRPYPTFGAALTGFQMGEVHGLGHIPPEQVEEVLALPGVTGHEQNLARYTMLILNLRSPLFDKPQTRRAVALAIDRQALARTVVGQAQPLVSPLLPHSWAYDPVLGAKLDYDPAQARILLDEAGWKLEQGGVRARDGVRMTVALTANEDVPSNVAVSKQLAGYLQAVGVDVKLALVSRERLLHDYLGPRTFHMALASWEAQGADPDVWAYWHSKADKTGGLNFSGWNNPVADQALDAARAVSDYKARAADYEAFQRAFIEDVPSVVLYGPLYTYATHAPAAGVRLPAADMLSPADRFNTIDEWSLGSSLP